MKMMQIDIRSYSGDSLDLYLREIGLFSFLGEEEEKRLIREKNQGSQHAFEKLVKSNLRFVVSIAKRYPNFGLAFKDLISYGNLGLIKLSRNLMRPEKIDLFLLLNGGLKMKS